MDSLFARPTKPLSNFVKQYWGIENCVSTGKSYLHRIVPCGMMELMFFLNKKPQVQDAKKEFTENAILSGHHASYYDMNIRGNLSMFSVSFYPHGAMMFFDIPLEEFYNKNVPLRYFLKNSAHIEEQLSNANTFDARVKIIEKQLLNLLIKNQKQYELKRISANIEAISRYGGAISTVKLAEMACLSRRQYERAFREHIGASPKQFNKVVRFQKALHIKQKDPGISLTSLAYDCGYYDQSHMINDFKSISGFSPKLYFKDCKPYSDYFSC